MLHYQIVGDLYYQLYGNIFSAELFFCAIYFMLYQPRRELFRIRLYLSIICYFAMANALWYIVTIIDSPIPVFNIIFFSLTTFVLSLGVTFSFRIGLGGAFYLSTAAYAVQNTAYSIGNVIKNIFQLALPLWADIIVFDFLIYPLVGFAFYLCFIRSNRKKFSDAAYDWRILLISFLILTICGVLNTVTDDLFAEYLNVEGVYLYGMRVCCGIYAIVGGMSAVLLQLGFVRENKLSEENEVLDQLLHSEKKRHELSKETIDIINVKCHDLKHQILQLAAIDDRGARSSYIKSIENSIAIYDSSVQTGNDALDIVIAEKSLICDNHKISFSCLADGEKLNFMDSADIAALFGNALDNAIERELLEDEDKRFISITIKQVKGALYIHVDNYCSVRPDFSDGLPQTTKDDKQHHGFGTKSIKSIVLRYGGELFMDVKNQRFNLDILFSGMAEQ